MAYIDFDNNPIEIPCGVKIVTFNGSATVNAGLNDMVELTPSPSAPANKEAIGIVDWYFQSSYSTLSGIHYDSSTSKWYAYVDNRSANNDSVVVIVKMAFFDSDFVS